VWRQLHFKLKVLWQLACPVFGTHFVRRLAKFVMGLMARKHANTLSYGVKMSI
jgi:hypothetical protein